MRQYITNMILAFDQFISTVLGGHPDDTLSQRLGRVQLAGGHPVGLFFARALDWIAFKLAGETDHCLRSLSGKTMAREIWNWGGSREMLDVDE